MSNTEMPRERYASLVQGLDIPIEVVEAVHGLLAEDGALSPEAIAAEVCWFFSDLGLDAHYFHTTPRVLIARHILSLYAAKVLARTSGEAVDLHLESETEEMAIYACREDAKTALAIERRIEAKFPSHRLQSYQSRCSAHGDDPDARLRLYFLTPPKFSVEDVDAEETDMRRIGADDFLANATAKTKERYEGVVKLAVERLGEVIKVFPRPEKKTKQIVVAHRLGSTHSYFSAISLVLNSYGIYSRRKYVEQFNNGVVIYSVHLDETVSDDVIESLCEDLSLVYVLPRTSLTPLFRERKLSAQEVTYAYAGWKFVHQFLTRYSDEYLVLAPAFADDPVRLGLLTQLKQRLSKDTFTEDRIFETINRHPELIKKLYADFYAYHFVSERQSAEPFDAAHNPELASEIVKTVATAMDQQIFASFLLFNRHVLKTNFYRDSKVALAFRLDPRFLQKKEYPERPFGVFFMVGGEFRGFHVRFRDVARGGIRIVRSRTPAAYNKNIDSLFDEVYGLSSTQQMKNKDIPEGGSKGAICLTLEHQDKDEVAFKKYVDSILDLLLPNEEIRDHYGVEEILYLGPDEGTAELMDWASAHARSRGYKFWKAFTTGKSVSLGGIPHDLYGMTTRSVHAFVVGILEKLGLDESELRKLQTGGPDGDLGSNEIKISTDKTIAIVDGSGVLYDPQGIDRAELSRLAEERKMVRHFAAETLGAGGFLVTVDDRDVTLPDGTTIESGLVFRNEFHLDPLSSADLFVPCGGRPDSVHINNVDKLFDDRLKPRFRFIVEGANLFFTQAARLALEKAGVVLFKDASANKGGVTSSSLEVLAALALSDEEFAEHMQVVGDTIPDFYRRYVEEVQQRIEENSRLEFECIWAAAETSGEPRSVLTDRVSRKINLLNDGIQRSKLFDDQALCRRALSQGCPKSLLEKAGLETILERVPRNYLKAIFGAQLASHYVYAYGLEASEIDFYEFLTRS